MIVIADKSGQLGNRLFLFAHFIACAAENSLTIYNPSFDEYAEFFESTQMDVLCRYPPKETRIPSNQGFRRLYFMSVRYLSSAVAKIKLKNRLLTCISLSSDNQSYCLDNAAAADELKASAITLVNGWLFRGENNMGAHAEEVRKYFTPLSIYRNNVDALMQSIRQSSDIVIGVHIRRGDYKDFLNGKYFYEVSDYVDIMQRLTSLFDGQRVTYLICSNESLQAEQFKAFTCRFGTGHKVEDMYSFARCDYIVGPPSTYTLWASFYGQVPLYTVDDLEKDILIDQFTIARS